MRAIHDACEDGRVRGKIAVVVTNASDCGGANWARERGIPVLIYPPKKSDVGGLTAMELTDATFDAEVASSGKSSFVKFYAPWYV